MKLDVRDHREGKSQHEARCPRPPRERAPGPCAVKRVAARALPRNPGALRPLNSQVARPPKLFGGTLAVPASAEPHAVIHPRGERDHRASWRDSLRECTRSSSFMIAPTVGGARSSSFMVRLTLAVVADIELDGATHPRRGRGHGASCLDPLVEWFGASSFMSGSTLGAVRGELEVGERHSSCPRANFEVAWAPTEHAPSILGARSRPIADAFHVGD